MDSPSHIHSLLQQVLRSQEICLHQLSCINHEISYLNHNLATTLPWSSYCHYPNPPQTFSLTTVSSFPSSDVHPYPSDNAYLNHPIAQEVPDLAKTSSYTDSNMLAIEPEVNDDIVADSTSEAAIVTRAGVVSPNFSSLVRTPTPPDLSLRTVVQTLQPERLTSDNKNVFAMGASAPLTADEEKDSVRQHQIPTSTLSGCFSSNFGYYRGSVISSSLLNPISIISGTFPPISNTVFPNRFCIPPTPKPPDPINNGDVSTIPPPPKPPESCSFKGRNRLFLMAPFSSKRKLAVFHKHQTPSLNKVILLPPPPNPKLHDAKILFQQPHKTHTEPFDFLNLEFHNHKHLKPYDHCQLSHIFKLKNQSDNTFVTEAFRAHALSNNWPLTAQFFSHTPFELLLPQILEVNDGQQIPNVMADHTFNESVCLIMKKENCSSVSFMLSLAHSHILCYLFALCQAWLINVANINLLDMLQKHLIHSMACKMLTIYTQFNSRPPSTREFFSKSVRMEHWDPGGQFAPTKTWTIRAAGCAFFPLRVLYQLKFGRGQQWDLGGHLDSSTLIRSTQFKHWDPGENFFTTLASSLQFKQWDPGKIVYALFSSTLRTRLL